MDLDKILTKKQYEIYKMYEEGYSRTEIVQITGHTRQNVHSLLHNAKQRINRYNALINYGFTDKDICKLSRRKNINLKKERKGKIVINYLEENKTISEFCEEFGISYSAAYQRYKKGLPPEKIFEKKEKIDYTLKKEYDLSLISDEYKEIIFRKNNGESFADIAKTLGCSSVNVRAKAVSAIYILNGKKNEKYLEKKREASKKWYREHLEQERERKKSLKNKLRNRKND